MSKLAVTAAAAAAVLVVAVAGYNLLPGLRIVGPGATIRRRPRLRCSPEAATSTATGVRSNSRRLGTAPA